MKRLAIILLVGILVLLTTGFGLKSHYKDRIFHPVAEAADPAAAPFPVELVTIDSDGLALQSWWHAPEDGERTVLYLHGNSKNVGEYVRGTRPLVEAGYGVLMLEYRGYGGNPGNLSDEGLIRDGLAALDWLAARGIAPETVAVYGYSLGTGVAVPLAAARDVAAVILAAPFASIAEMGYRSYPRWFVDLLLDDRFDSIDRMGEVDEPVLIIHGSADGLIPLSQSALLADAAPDGRVTRHVIDGASHGWDLFEPAGNALILDFLDGLQDPAPTRRASAG